MAETVVACHKVLPGFDPMRMAAPEQCGAAVAINDVWDQVEPHSDLYLRHSRCTEGHPFVEYARRADLDARSTNNQEKEQPDDRRED